MKHFRLDKNNALILVIGILSVWNIITSVLNGPYLSIAVSLIGIAGLASFFMGKAAFRYLIWIWIFAQTIIIESTFTDQLTNIQYHNSVLDLSQVFKLQFGFFLSGDTHSYEINFNFLTILYFFLFRNLKVSSWVNKSIEILVMKGNLDIVFQEPVIATFTKRVNLAGDDNWMLARLNNPIIFENNAYDQILVHAEDGLLTHTIRLVPAGETLDQNINPLLKYQKVEWLMLA